MDENTPTIMIYGPAASGKTCLIVGAISKKMLEELLRKYIPSTDIEIYQTEPSNLLLKYEGIENICYTIFPGQYSCEKVVEGIKKNSINPKVFWYIVDPRTVIECFGDKTRMEKIKEEIKYIVSRIPSLESFRVIGSKYDKDGLKQLENILEVDKTKTVGEVVKYNLKKLGVENSIYPPLEGFLELLKEKAEKFSKWDIAQIVYVIILATFAEEINKAVKEANQKIKTRYPVLVSILTLSREDPEDIQLRLEGFLEK